MKKILLLFALSFCILSASTTVAQESPVALQLFNEAVFYGMYDGPTTQPVPEGLQRNSNSSYGKKLTQDQLDSFGNTLTMTVTLHALCDNYDRIGNVNLVMAPKGAPSYVYNEVQRIEVGRFITPFMNKNRQPDDVPYVFEVNNLTRIFHDTNITSVYDIWIELEVYGHQGTPGVDGAANEIAGCSARKDVYAGSLQFVSSTNPNLEQGPNFFKPLIYNFQLKNYDAAGTDVVGQTTKTINFTLENDVPNAKLYLITSNHGSNSGGEEYIRRFHYVKVDGTTVLTYKPGGVSCTPFLQYNTQPSCIYYDCSQNPSPPLPNNDAAWSWNNWCPGDKIPTRVIDLGTLTAGNHTFNISVPDAQFAGRQGYFPLSVYMQGGTETLDTEDFGLSSFTMSPNPATDLVEIGSADLVKEVAVYNTLGQNVWTGKSSKVNLSGMQTGVYMVKVVFENNKTATRKLIKN
jgi:hypothetical protein